MFQVAQVFAVWCMWKHMMSCDDADGGTRRVKLALWSYAGSWGHPAGLGAAAGGLCSILSDQFFCQPPLEGDKWPWGRLSTWVRHEILHCKSSPYNCYGNSVTGLPVVRALLALPCRQTVVVTKLWSRMKKVNSKESFALLWASKDVRALYAKSIDPCTGYFWGWHFIFNLQKVLKLWALGSEEWSDETNELSPYFCFLLGCSKTLNSELKWPLVWHGMRIIVSGCIVVAQNIMFCKNKVILFGIIDTDMEITSGLWSRVTICNTVP